MSSVSVYTRTHSVTYVADNILKSIKDIIRLSGLDPSNFADSHDSYSRAIGTWLESEHLKKIELEIYDPDTDKLITRWDINIDYTWSSGDGSFWTDTDQLKAAINKSGIAPSKATYTMLLDTKAGRPDVDGWGPGNSRSTDGMVRQSLGSTVEHNGLTASASYWRSAS